MGVLNHFPGMSSTTTASTTTASTTVTEDKKTPWWVWLIVALVGLGIAAAFASK
jgi:hypothetical protein